MSADDETRRIELEIEVPGTPEEVWEAIATGPGITAWMHPTEVEERAGGQFSFDMGSGPQDGTVTAWEPPRRFVEQTEWAASETTPAASIATEWLVEARGAGTCVVRMVMSGFGTGASWDDEISGLSEGMELALANLRRYLTHFAGRRGTWARAFGTGAGTRAENWEALTRALGLPADPPEGERVATSGPDVPRLAGSVSLRYEGRWHSALLLVLDEPSPGIAHLVAFGDRGWTTIQAVLYGDDAATLAAREEPAWQAWMRDRFPTPAAA